MLVLLANFSNTMNHSNEICQPKYQAATQKHNEKGIRNRFGTAEKYKLKNRAECPENGYQQYKRLSKRGGQHLLGMDKRDIGKYQKTKHKAQIQNLHYSAVNRQQFWQLFAPFENAPEKHMEQKERDII